MQQSTGDTKRSSRWTIAITALVCLALGSAGGAWVMQRRQTSVRDAPPVASPQPVASLPNAQAALAQAIVVSVPADAIKRMALAFAPVTLETVRTEIRVPGTVEADGYREVPVTPVAGGIATEVTAELGQTVKRGQKMARIFSQELADAQTALIGMNADLEVTHKKLLRTEELVGLGAASREELEAVQAEHQTHNAHIEQAHQKLILLGLTQAQAAQAGEGSQVSSEIIVPAPIDGVVLSRSMNLGQVVTAGQQLFKVTDLSSVWIEGNLLEDHFNAVRVGSQAAITTAAYPGRRYRGVVDYIDPRVDPQTRTVKVRVIVGNKDLALRLGMYADMLFTTTVRGRVPVVPSSALQQIGPNSVVYVRQEAEANRFLQQNVALGEETPDGRRVLSGLHGGENVVTDGSFLLRAESLRQHPQ